MREQAVNRLIKFFRQDGGSDLILTSLAVTLLLWGYGGQCGNSAAFTQRRLVVVKTRLSSRAAKELEKDQQANENKGSNRGKGVAKIFNGPP